MRPCVASSELQPSSVLPHQPRTCCVMRPCVCLFRSAQTRGELRAPAVPGSVPGPRGNRFLGPLE
eukprot:4191141-Heterocapsa_arctica.AAC.1